MTIKEYMLFVEDTDSNFPEWTEKDNLYNVYTGTDDYYKYVCDDKRKPIVGISWCNAKAYAEWLSEKTGKKFRLPTEAEWEYAARAGTDTKFSFGDGGLVDYAWYSSNSNDTSYPVGEKRPNPWGLYDMHGNVREWCEDWYASYNDTPTDGSAYSYKKKSKVLRGGSWFFYDYRLRSASRYGDDPNSTDGSFGFRLVMEKGV